ncbi:TIR domain-containing protein, partial [Bartonella sp. AA16SXTY]|uniref:TIR domain-containing protein n=1 Tax=Bartonella sp. AA16SXTY TaxID=3243429 RepID=UPI0035CF6CD0
WFEKTGTLSFQGKDPAAKKLKEDLTPYIEQESKTPSPKTSSNTSNKKIFIVHGHDHVSLKDLELSLRRLGFEPYILQNTGGNGLPIIETLKKEI